VLANRLTADEPRASGGTETGPTPYELLMAALGSCTSMTLAMYARRKGWPLMRVSVNLSQQNIHAADCATCDVTGGSVVRITRDITLEGPLEEAQRVRLLEMAERCPVHRTLAGRLEVVTRLV
jgi:putative redox protein